MCLWRWNVGVSFSAITNEDFVQAAAVQRKSKIGHDVELTVDIFHIYSYYRGLDNFVVTILILV